MNDLITISQNELNLLLSGRHPDPFRILGYHHIYHSGKTIGIIRIYHPRYKRVEIIWEDKVEACALTSNSGFFEILLPNRLEFFDYRIKAKFSDTENAEMIDPYNLLPVLSDQEIFDFSSGKLLNLWEHFGANPKQHHGLSGVHFSLFKPDAEAVSVVGDFNKWEPTATPMRQLGESGIWEIFLPEIPLPAPYRFILRFKNGETLQFRDPLEKQRSENSESLIVDLKSYEWENSTLPSVKTLSDAISILPFSPSYWHSGQREWTKATFHKAGKYCRNMRYTHVLLPDVFVGKGSVSSKDLSFCPHHKVISPIELMECIDILKSYGLKVCMQFSKPQREQTEFSKVIEKMIETAAFNFRIKLYRLNGVMIIDPDNPETNDTFFILTRETIDGKRAEDRYKINGSWVNIFLNTSNLSQILGEIIQLLQASSTNQILSLFFPQSGTSLLKMIPGTDFQKFASLRLAFSMLFCFPGKKIHAMGMETGQWHNDWMHKFLNWDLLKFPLNQGVQKLVKDLNEIYLKEMSLTQDSQVSTEWIGLLEPQFCFGILRKYNTDSEQHHLACFFNLGEDPVWNCRMGVPVLGNWEELINSDSQWYGGFNHGNLGGRASSTTPVNWYSYSLPANIASRSSCIFRIITKNNPSL